MSTLNNGDPMTRAQLMKFNPLWNGSDRAVLTEDLDTFGAVAFTYVVSGFNRYVRVLDASGAHVMDVSPGTFYYKGGHDRAGSEPYLESNEGRVYRTSRAGAGGGVATPEPDYGPRCDTCGLHHRGECDR